MSDARRIKELLRDRVEELASYLFPNGRREGIHWCVGDISGSRGNSLKICLTGEKVGLWGDFADTRKHSRSLLDLWMQARKVDFRTALHEAAEWLGQPLNGSNGTRMRHTRPSWSEQRGPEQPFNWMQCVAAVTEAKLEQLAKARGLSRGFCSWLHERGLIGLCHGCIAFPICNEGRVVVAAHYLTKNGTWVAIRLDSRPTL